MDNNTKLQKLYEQLAATGSEKELDAMLDENIAGAGSPLTVTITGLIVAATTGFDWCPTGACTYSCRV